MFGIIRVFYGVGYVNLKNMRQFFEEYAGNAIGQSLTAQLEKGLTTQTFSANSQNPTFSQPLAVQLGKPAISQTVSVQFEERYLNSFFVSASVIM